MGKHEDILDSQQAVIGDDKVSLWNLLTNGGLTTDLDTRTDIRMVHYLTHSYHTAQVRETVFVPCRTRGTEVHAHCKISGEVSAFTKCSCLCVCVCLCVIVSFRAFQETDLY